MSLPTIWRSMARASPTASSQRVSGLRNEPRSPRGIRVRYGHMTQARVPWATARSLLSTWPSGVSAEFPSVGVGPVLHSLKHRDRTRRHDGRYGVLVDELGVTVAPQQDAEIVEPRHEPLQFDSINEKYGDGGLGFPNVVEECVLEVLRLLSCHEFFHLLGPCRPSFYNSSCAPRVTRRIRTYTIYTNGREPISLIIVVNIRSTIFP